ncbi:MAG TPA: conjugal transfer protein TraF [Vicinamibacterales bacterium]|jgi:hypothetical protein
MRNGTRAAVIGAVLAALAGRAAPARAQTVEVLGTRAAGMGGAFVAVADDASAVYWNPAGLALGGSYFSLVLDNNLGEAKPDAGAAGKQSATLAAFSTLPIGLSYYRLSSTSVSPLPTALAPSPVFRVNRLTTHHGGVTLVQSVTSMFAVATTLKLVRGVAASGVVIGGDRDALVDDSGVIGEEASTKFDADIGVMASFGALRAGVVVRNVREPEFETADGGAIEMKRHSRAGISYRGVSTVILAADIDLDRAKGPRGDSRNLALGAEARLVPRAFVRTGLRFNTLSDQPGGRAAVYSIGASVAAFRSLMIDGQVTAGSEHGDRGWGIAARVVY